MRVYIEITGYVKNHQKFKFLFFFRESEKPIFTIFPEIFYEKMGRESGKGISSETTWSLEWDALEPRVRRPGASSEYQAQS